MGLDAVKMLFWCAILNGILAPPLIFLIVLLTSDAKVMGERVNSPLQRVLGWITFTIMAAAAIALRLSEAYLKVLACTICPGRLCTLGQ
jgi:Mn2+/Fe2+ NRAMP family transporter